MGQTPEIEQGERKTPVSAAGTCSENICQEGEFNPLSYEGPKPAHTQRARQVRHRLIFVLPRGCVTCPTHLPCPAQVAERALFLWNNEHLVTVGVLSMQYPNPLLPVIYGPLRERSTRHWNTTVEGLAHNVLRMYNEQDAAAFERYVRGQAAAVNCDCCCGARHLSSSSSC